MPSANGQGTDSIVAPAGPSATTTSSIPSVATPVSVLPTPLPRPTLVSARRVPFYRDEPLENITWDDMIAVRIAGCRALYAKQQDQKTDLILYINNVPLPTVKSSYRVPADVDTAVFFFDLSDNAHTDTIWRELLPAKAVLHGAGRMRVFVTAGLEKSDPILPEAQSYSEMKNNMTIQFFDRVWMYIFLGLFALVLYLVWLMCEKSELIKTTLPNDNTVFSLSKSQMVLWTVIVAGSYVYLWLVTADQPTIDGSILILLGISVGTTTISRKIDTSNFSRVTDPQNLVLKSKGFLYDILSDDSGISAHRLQNVLFTVVMACVFISSVVTHLEMPQFDSTLLALMGISSAGYLSLKPSELTNPPGGGVPQPGDVAPPPAPAPAAAMDPTIAGA